MIFYSLGDADGVRLSSSLSRTICVLVVTARESQIKRCFFFRNECVKNVLATMLATAYSLDNFLSSSYEPGTSLALRTTTMSKIGDLSSRRSQYG